MATSLFIYVPVHTTPKPRRLEWSAHALYVCGRCSVLHAHTVRRFRYKYATRAFYGIDRMRVLWITFVGIYIAFVGHHTTSGTNIAATLQLCELCWKFDCEGTISMCILSVTNVAVASPTFRFSQWAIVWCYTYVHTYIMSKMLIVFNCNPDYSNWNLHLYGSWAHPYRGWMKSHWNFMLLLGAICKMGDFQEIDHRVGHVCLFILYKYWKIRQ